MRGRQLSDPNPNPFDPNFPDPNPSTPIPPPQLPDSNRRPHYTRFASNRPRFKLSSRQVGRVKFVRVKSSTSYCLAPNAQYPFALVFISSGGHFPPMPTCPNVHRSQNAHLLHSAHLPQMPICSGAHFSWCPFPPKCPFAPNAHLPQCLSVPKCPFPQMFICASPHMPPMLICPHLP